MAGATADLENTPLTEIEKKTLKPMTLEEPSDENDKSSSPNSSKSFTKKFFLLSSITAYNIYLIYAIYHHTVNQRTIESCNGLGFLLILTGIVYAFIFYFFVIKKYLFRHIKGTIARRFQCSRSIRIINSKIFSYVMTVLVILAVTIFLIIDTANDRYRLVSAGGIVVLIGLGTIFSKNRRKIVWRHIIWGLAIQFLLGLLILRWEQGNSLFKCIGGKVNTFLAFTDAGSQFVFGYLVHQRPFLTSRLVNSSVAFQVASDINTAGAVPSIVVFRALSTVYFFSFLVSMLFHWGALQWIIIHLGWILQATIGTTACESISSAANIFIGQAQTPFLIKPYLPDLTLSEIHSVMAGGFATIAGTVLAAYISFGIPAAHLISASVLSAPAALAYAKLFYPETEKSKTNSKDIVIEKSNDANVLDAATQGASDSGILVVNITAIVIAFIAFMAFLNGVAEFLGDIVGIDGLSFEYILGKMFIPLSFIMGVEWEDCEKVARLIGIKTVLNEFIAYQQLGQLISNGELSERSITVATYALCGFANPSSVGVQIATLSAMAPSRHKDFALVAFRALISGMAACFLTACIAGTLHVQTSPSGDMSQC